MIGAASAINESLEIVHTPRYVPEREAILDAARQQLGDDAYQAALAEGRAMTDRANREIC